MDRTEGAATVVLERVGETGAEGVGRIRVRREAVGVEHALEPSREGLVGSGRQEAVGGSGRSGSVRVGKGGGQLPSADGGGADPASRLEGAQVALDRGVAAEIG